MSQMHPSQQPGSLYEVAPFSSAPTRNPLGVASLALGVVLLVVGGVQHFYTLSLFSGGSGSPALVVASNTGFTLVQILLVLGTLGLGIAAVLKTGASKLAAGIGLGFGLSFVFSIVTNLVVGMILS